MIFNKDLKADNSPFIEPTQSAPAAEPIRKRSHAENVERGKRKFKTAGIVFIGGSFAVILGLQGLGNLAGADEKPKAFSSVSETPAPTDAAAASVAGNVAAPAVHMTPTGAKFEISVSDAAGKNVAYHVDIVNTYANLAPLNKDFKAGEKVSITDTTWTRTNNIMGDNVGPTYLVTVTSDTPGVGGQLKVDTTSYKQSTDSKELSLSLKLKVTGDKLEATYADSFDSVAEGSAPAPKVTPTATAPSVPSTEFSLWSEVHVMDAKAEPIGYHLLVVNKTSGDVVMDEDIATGQRATIKDAVFVPNAEVATTTLPVYDVTITTPSGSYTHTTSASDYVTSSGSSGKSIGVRIDLLGTNFTHDYLAGNSY